MKVKKEILQELSWNGEADGFRVVQERITDTSRWSIQYEQIVHHEDSKKYYRTRFSRGATEQQDERPYEYDDDEIELSEVFPVSKTVVVYESAPAPEVSHV